MKYVPDRSLRERSSIISAEFLGVGGLPLVTLGKDGGLCQNAATAVLTMKRGGVRKSVPRE